MNRKLWIDLDQQYKNAIEAGVISSKVDISTYRLVYDKFIQPYQSGDPKMKRLIVLDDLFDTFF